LDKKIAYDLKNYWLDFDSVLYDNVFYLVL